MTRRVRIGLALVLMLVAAMPAPTRPRLHVRQPNHRQREQPQGPYFRQENGGETPVLTDCLAAVQCKLLGELADGGELRAFRKSSIR